MHVIEFDSVVENAAIPLPGSALLASGLPVRVVVMFEEKAAANSARHLNDAISILCANPLLVPDFEPLSLDEAHERGSCG